MSLIFQNSSEKLGKGYLMSIQSWEPAIRVNCKNIKQNKKPYQPLFFSLAKLNLLFLSL